MANSEVALVFPSAILERWRRWDSGSRQRVSEYWRGIAAQDPLFRRVFMCVELVFGDGTVLRIARETLTTTSAIDGTVYTWLQGLIEEPSLEHGIQIGQSQSAAARGVSFTLPTSLVNLDINAILLRGGMLAGIGEVSLQRRGDDYDRRLVLMRGDMSGGVSFGAAGESLTVQLVDPRETSSLKIPKYTTTTTRWPLAQSSAVGLRYPLILNGFPKVPCLRVLNSHGVTGLYYLVCGDGRDLQIDAVYVNAVLAAGVYAPATEFDTRDAMGASVKVVNFSASAGPWVENDVVYADVSRRTTTPALSAIAIVRRLLQGYTSLGDLGLNQDLFSVADARMPGNAPTVLINGSGEQAVDVLDWIEGTFLPSFPMIHMIYEGRGIGPVIVDRRTGPDGAGVDGHLTGGALPLLERVSGPDEAPKSQLYNEFEIRYAQNLQDDTWGGVVLRSPANSQACLLSQQMTSGRRFKGTIDSPFIQSKTLADYMIDWMVAHLTLPWYDVTWTCVPSVLTRYRPGMNVRYTDPKFAAFTDADATILGFTYGRERSEITIRIWHPAWRQLLLGTV